MDHFQARGGVLHAEDVPLPDIAREYGTPTYVYSAATIERHLRVLSDAMGKLDHLICYAIKANGNLAILELMKDLGSGFDAVSVGELARAMKIGANPNTVILSGVGKREDEIAAGLRCGVLYIAAESEAELETINRVATSLGMKAPISIRVNPDVDAKTHPYIATGLRQNKFGVPFENAHALYEKAVALEHLDPCGVTCHIGSQITEISPFVDAAQRMASLARDLQSADVPLRHIGLGGGLGVPYGNENPPPPRAYGAALAEVFGDLGLRVILEPGRVIVGNAGVLLTRVVRRKSGGEREFVIVDAAMNDLMRPSLYKAVHQIVPVLESTADTRTVDVVGPVCESADTFASAFELPEVQENDLLAIRTAGAYGFVMSHNYNGRPRAAEVLCRGGQALLARERESLADLWRGERRLDGQPFDAAVPRGVV